MTESPKSGGYLRQAWLVILLALFYGGALAGIQTTLGPIIEENKKRETYEKIPELVLGPEKATEVEVTVAEVEVVGNNGKPRTVYRAMGNFITDEDLVRNQFAGLGSDREIRVVKTEPSLGNNEIRALTGATISSDSVADIINKAVANLREPILQAALPTDTNNTKTSVQE